MLRGCKHICHFEIFNKYYKLYGFREYYVLQMMEFMHYILFYGKHEIWIKEMSATCDEFHQKVLIFIRLVLGNTTNKTIWSLSKQSSVPCDDIRTLFDGNFGSYMNLFWKCLPKMKISKNVLLKSIFLRNFWTISHKWVGEA